MLVLFGMAMGMVMGWVLRKHHRPGSTPRPDRGSRPGPSYRRSTPAPIVAPAPIVTPPAPAPIPPAPEPEEDEEEAPWDLPPPEHEPFPEPRSAAPRRPITAPLGGGGPKK